MKKQTYFVGVVLAFICLIILGVLPIISNSRPEAFQALSFAFFLSVWQFLISIFPVSTEWKYQNRGIFNVNLSPSIRRRSIAIILMTGMTFGLSTFIFVLAVKKAGATNAAIAIQAYPIFSILWETLFLNKRKTIPELLVTLILIATLYYLGTGGTWAIEGGSLWFVLALGVPFLWSVAHVIIKEVIDKTPITPLQVTFSRVFVSSVFLGFVSLWVLGPGVLWNDLVHVEFQKYAFAMGFVYYLELVVWFYAVRSLDVSLAGSIVTPWPALTLVLAVVFLGDEVKSYQVISLSLVAICVYSLLYLGARKMAARGID